MNGSNKTMMVLLALALTTTVVAGCFGGKDAVETKDPTGGATVVADDPEGNAPRQTTEQEALNEPAAHYHHYWGELQEIDIYNGAIPFQNMNNKYLLQYSTLAWAEFDLETDGDDACFEPNGETGCSNTQPVNKDLGKADTVFAGTDKITVTFPEKFPEGVGAVIFWYKPSGTPKFLPENGVIITPEQRTYEIKLNEVGMSDPPHQFSTSRWKFRVVATNAFCAAYNLPPEACPPAMVTSTDALQSPDGTWAWPDFRMTAHNGGENHLDPPHPDFWKSGDVISLDKYEGEVVDPAVQTPLVRERVNALTDISFPPNYIVPLGTEKVAVKVSWTNTNPVALPDGADFKMKLYYHGADSLDYVAAEPVSGMDHTGMSVTDATYEIFDDADKAIKADPPYESNSFWRFKLVPTLVTSQGETENFGIFEGTFMLTFEAHKKPGYVLT